jgi:hypothetical protein
MSLKAMYNEIAENYATADRFGSLTKSHSTAISQIRSEHLGNKKHYKKQI